EWPGTLRLAVPAPDRWPSRARAQVQVEVANLGRKAWPGFGFIPRHLVQLRACIRKPDEPSCGSQPIPLPADVPPGGRVRVAIPLEAPFWDGPYVLDVRLVQGEDGALDRCGVAMLHVPIRVGPRSWAPALRRLGRLEMILPEMESRPSLSVLVPVYNEVATVRALLGRVRAVPIPKEIIVIDDCSTDGTREALEAFHAEVGDSPENRLVLLSHAQNQGKGAAVRTGIAHVTGEVGIIQEARPEYDPGAHPPPSQPIPGRHSAGALRP